MEPTNTEQLVATELGTTHRQILQAKMRSLLHSIDEVQSYEVYGKLLSAIGTSIEAYLPNVKVGDLCRIKNSDTSPGLLAEVVSLSQDSVRLLPFGNIANISQNSLITRIGIEFHIKVGDFLLGKVVDGFGKITANLDPDGHVHDEHATNFELRPIYSLAPDPYSRPLIDAPMLTGVKAIDLLNTCGGGQRVGIFAGPGVGKTTLMGMIIRNSQVDVVVVGLVGERGREVREFIDLEIGKEAAAKCVIVVATSDRPAVEQLKCAYVAQTIAEYFRDQGKNVLLFVDSITRFARAGREVGLSSGEQIVRGGYPPSVFLSFPRLMERAGKNLAGSITAFYTVLMEGENTSNDPIADEVRSILDGHIILSKKLAERGHFPAIDNLKSLSRVADRIISTDHANAARRIRLLLSQYEELEFLLRVGEYKEGNDALADEAVRKNKAIEKLLQQDTRELEGFNGSLAELIQLSIIVPGL